MRAAIKVFSTRGYDPATTREIAAEAGCAEGLIHRYFQGKEGLLSTLIHQNGKGDAQALERHCPLAGSLEQELRQLLEWQLKRLSNHRDYLRIAVPRALLDSNAARHLRSYCMGESVDAIEARLRKFQARREIRDDVDLQAVAHVIAGMGFNLGFMSSEVCRLRKKQLASITDQMAHVLAQGMQARS